MLDDKERDDADDIAVDADATDTPDEYDVESAEATSKDKIKDLRDKLKQCEEEKRTHLEELQRTKADFLNAKRRLEEERVADRNRLKMAHAEELLPLCDSFTMAMADKDAWAEAPEKWRKGVEGIYAQLQSLLQQYQVTQVDPTGEPFDPQHHEAVGSEAVSDATKNDTVVKVVQLGYVMTVNGEERPIRPARVIVGTHE